MLVSEATRWSSSPEGGFEQSERLLKRKTMKRIGGLALMAACLGVLTSCSLGPGDRTHGENSGVSRDFSNIKGGGDSAVSGVADVTATGVGSIGGSIGTGSPDYKFLPNLGSFERQSSSFEIFDPCESSRGRFLASLGLKKVGEDKRETGFRSCRFTLAKSDGNSANITLESRHYSMGEVKNAFPDGSAGVGEYADLIYLVEESLVVAATCTGYIETVGGTFSVSWTDVSNGASNKENCRNAERLISTFI